MGGASVDSSPTLPARAGCEPAGSQEVAEGARDGGAEGGAASSGEAAGAAHGMAQVEFAFDTGARDKPLIGMSNLGVLTQGAMHALELFEQLSGTI